MAPVYTPSSGAGYYSGRGVENVVEPNLLTNFNRSNIARDAELRALEKGLEEFELFRSRSPWLPEYLKRDLDQTSSVYCDDCYMPKSRLPLPPGFMNKDRGLLMTESPILSSEENFLPRSLRPPPGFHHRELQQPTRESPTSSSDDDQYQPRFPIQAPGPLMRASLGQPMFRDSPPTLSSSEDEHQQNVSTMLMGPLENPTAKDFRLTAMKPRPQFLNEIVSYTIEPFNDNIAMIPRNFRVMVYKPHHHGCQHVNVKYDLKSKKLAFLIVPSHLGLHTVVIEYAPPVGKPEEIIGSPMKLKIIKMDSEVPCLPCSPHKIAAAAPYTDISDTQRPWGFTEHQSRGLVYISDRQNNCVWVYNNRGKKIGKIDPEATKESEVDFKLRKPAGIAVDERNDRIFVADKDNHRIVIFNGTGQPIDAFGVYGTRAGEFNYPWGLALSPDGQILAVADSKNRRIQFFDAKNFDYINKFTLTEKCPLSYKQLFDYPRDVIYDPNGHILYVSDFNVHAILMIDVRCYKYRFFSSTSILKRPQGMCWDHHGNLLVADSLAGKIVALDKKGQLVDSPKSFANLQSPQNVLQLQNGFVLALTEKNGVVTIAAPNHR